MSDSTSAQVGEHIGMVKWFNYKLGYGFITVLMENNEENAYTFKKVIN